MKVLYRYLLSHFLSMLLIVVPGLAGVFLLVDAFERLDDFVEAGVPMSKAALYFLLKLPDVLFELFPLMVLLSGLLAVALLARHSELLALRSHGVRPFQVLFPFLSAALVLSIGMVIIKGFYIPSALNRAQAIWAIEVKHSRPKGVIKGQTLLYHGKNSIWTTELGTPDARRLLNVRWLQYDRDYRVIQILAAPQADYKKGIGWTFKGGVRIFRSDKAGYVTKGYKKYVLKGQETPEDFVSVDTPPENMDLVTLWKSIRRLKELGFPSYGQETLFWNAIFYPLMAVSLLAVGLPLTLAMDRWGIGVGLGLGVMIGFSAWALWSVVLTLGNTGRLPGPIAPLIVHIVLVGTSLVLIKRMRF